MTRPPHDLPLPGMLTRPPAKRRALPPRRAPLPRGPVAPTPQQQANTQVSAQIDPILASQNQFNKTQNQAIQSFASSLLGKLQPIAGQVGGDYDKAIGQQGAFTTATADALRRANPDSDVQKMLASIQAPAAQGEQLSGQLSQAFGGGAAALQFMGGSAGSQLASDKAGAQAYARELPGINALKGQQDLASALYQQKQDREQVLNQRPGLYQNALQGIQQQQQVGIQNQQADRSFAENQRQFNSQRSQQLLLAKMANETDTAKAAQDWQKFVAQQNREDARLATREANQNARTGATIAGENQRAVTAAAARVKAKGKSGHLTAGQLATIQQKAASEADTFYYGVEPKPHYDSASGTWIDTPGTGVPGISWKQAWHRLKTKYPALSTKQVEAILANYYAPGERGRPGGAPPVTPQQAQSAVAPPSWITGTPGG